MFMNKTQVKKYLALLMAIVLTMGSILPGNSVFASSTEKNCAENEKETVVVASEQEDCEEKLELYDAEVRADLEQEEIAIAEDIVVAQSYGFDVEQNLDGISYDSSKVKVTYYKNMSTFDGNKVGDYNTYYKVEPISGKDAYLICRTISVREPETAVAEANKEENKEDDAEAEPGNEDSLLSEGEIAGFDTGETMTIAMASMPVLKTSVVSAYGSTSQASMKVGCAGYAKYCGHSIGIKYITTSGAYHNRLVYCMDLNKNTTNGNCEGKYRSKSHQAKDYLLFGKWSQNFKWKMSYF